MQHPEVEKTFVKIVGDVCGQYDEDITPEKHFENDFYADSLTRLEIIMKLEDAFDIEISDKEAENIETVGQALEALKAKLAKKG